MNSEQIINELFVGAIITYMDHNRKNRVSAGSPQYYSACTLIGYIKAIHRFNYKIVSIKINDTIRERIEKWCKDNG